MKLYYGVLFLLSFSLCAMQQEDTGQEAMDIDYEEVPDLVPPALERQQAYMVDVFNGNIDNNE